MTRYVALQNGDLSTPSVWGTVTNTPTLHASTTTILGATNFSGTFTAPNTTNACVGFLVHQSTTNPVSDTFTFTLQQNTVDTVSSISLSTSVLYDDTATYSKWYFVKLPDFVFTSTTAGYYRFKITRTGATTNYRLAADSGGANFSFMAVDNRTGTPVAGDDIYVIGANGTGTVVVTVRGTTGSIGSGTDTTGITTRTIGSAITIGCGGTLVYDTAANTTLQVKGTRQVYGSSYNKGEFQIGTVASPYPSNLVAKYIIDENGTTTNYGVEHRTYAREQMHGRQMTGKTKYSSGVGTAANPLIVSDSVDWLVGDEICITPGTNSATNYNEAENKFIITKNSPTSYVLSNTSGGVEAALTYTHSTDSEVINLQRNIIVTTTNTAHGLYYFGDTKVQNDVDIDWVRFETTGSTASNKFGCTFETNTDSYSAIDNNVFYRPLYVGHYVVLNKTVETFTGNICSNANQTNNAMDFYINASVNKTYNDCYSLKSTRCGFYMNTTSQTTFNRCKAIASAITGGSNYNWLLSNAFNITLNDCEAQAGRTYAISLTSNTSGIAINDFLSGTYAKNQSGSFTISAQTLQSILATRFKTDGGTLVSGNTGLLTGSAITFESLEGTTNNNKWYTNGGYFQSTGYGLADTTVWNDTDFGAASSGQLGFRGDPDNTSTNLLTYVFYPVGKVIGNQQYKNVDIACRVKIANSTYYDDVHSLTLRAVYDGGTTQTIEANDTTDAQQLTLHIVPQTTNPRIDLYLDMNTHEAGALADVYIGEFAIGLPSNTSIDNTRFSLWSNGMPLVPDSTIPTPNSILISSSKVDYGTDTIGNVIKGKPKLVAGGGVIL